MAEPHKNELHPRNVHNERYDFDALTSSCAELKPFVKPNKYGDLSVNFSDPLAVKILNKALLKHFYGIGYWDLPDQYLCPPIPGRADYIHYIADLLASSNGGVIPKGSGIRGLDIGTGANCIYPLLGNKLYGWQFVGTEIDPKALEHAQKIVDLNDPIADLIFLRKQSSSLSIFKDIIHRDERFDFTICNPPFHASAEEAQQHAQRKVSNLKGKQVRKPTLNFGGVSHELWCNGGEKAFINQMISESELYAQQCFWFTSLVSKQTTLASIFKTLEQSRALDTRIIEMAQGQKISRFVAWTFLSKRQQEEWRNKRWRKDRTEL
jgi:23S rRNA (adenine1618-N6)-methyltransferase